MLDFRIFITTYKSDADLYDCLDGLFRSDIMVNKNRKFKGFTHEIYVMNNFGIMRDKLPERYRGKSGHFLCPCLSFNTRPGLTPLPSFPLSRTLTRDCGIVKSLVEIQFATIFIRDKLSTLSCNSFHLRSGTRSTC